MRVCVYTAVFGRYDGLLDPPAGTDGVDFICFTDDPELASTGWDVRVVRPAFAEDGVRSARLVKILGDESLDEYDVVVYVDASVRLREAPLVLVDAWLPIDAEMAVAHHSYRDTLLDEFDEVIRLNYDDRARVYEQIVHYGLAHPDQLERRPLWTGILIRRNTPRVRAAMRVWAQHVLRYSRRDQLSFPIAVAEAAVRVNVVEIDNFSSEMHEWPVIEQRRVSKGKAPLVPLGPLVADLRRAHRRIDELQQEIQSLAPDRLSALDAANRDLQAQVQAGVAERVVLEQRLRDAIREAGALQEQLHPRGGAVRAAAMHLRGGLLGRIRRPRD